MCICINCKWVDRCITYHDVENNHGVDHICDIPDFKAKKPFIHVNIVKDTNCDYLLPTVDEELLSISKNKNIFPTTVIIPDYRFIDIFNDKQKSASYLSENGFGPASLNLYEIESKDKYIINMIIYVVYMLRKTNSLFIKNLLN